MEKKGTSVIILSFIASMMLIIFPMPTWAQSFRPEWTAMILIYWCNAIPHRVSIGTAWTVGLFSDALTGTLLGQHALGYSILAYLCILLHERIRIYPLWQQALTVLMLLTLNQLIHLWITGIIGNPPRTWLYWVESVMGMLLWPWLFIFMRNVKRKFQIN